MARARSHVTRSRTSKLTLLPWSSPRNVALAAALVLGMITRACDLTAQESEGLPSRVTGRIVDASAMRGLGAVEVRLAGGGLLTTTDSAGDFALSVARRGSQAARSPYE